MRDAGILRQRGKTAMSRLYLLRHGMTSANELHQYCGWSDVPLSECGVRLLQEKKSRKQYPAADGLRIVSSGMKRTDQTLEVLFGYTGAEHCPELREMNFGQFELHSYEELRVTEAYQAWISGDNESHACPDGESGAAMKARVLAAVQRLCSSEQDVLVCLHGGPIAAVMQYYFAAEHKNRYEWQPDFGEGYDICFSPSGLTYRRLPW